MNETTNYDMVTKALALAQDENFKLAALNRELLEALKAVTDSNINRPDLVPMWKKVYDAIAKAEGRA